MLSRPSKRKWGFPTPFRCLAACWSVICAAYSRRNFHSARRAQHRSPSIRMGIAGVLWMIFLISYRMECGYYPAFGVLAGIAQRPYCRPCGMWQNHHAWTLRPQVVVLGVGVEASLPLVQQVSSCSIPIEAADHHRIDLHGWLPGGAWSGYSADEMGVAVLLMECLSQDAGLPYHLEIKVAPRELWNCGYMPSGDNLKGVHNPSALWVQIQAIAAMHDRFPTTDLLNVRGALSPVMSAPMPVCMAKSFKR